MTGGLRNFRPLLASQLGGKDFVVEKITICFKFYIKYTIYANGYSM